MVAYEFYRRDEANGHHLMGILPERRKYQKRITKESIMKWARIVSGDHADMSNVFFLKVTIEKGEVGGRDPGLKRRTERSQKRRTLMNIRSSMTWVLGPILLSLPMMCMHGGDGHHDGDHHFSIYQPFVQSPAHDHESSRSSEQGRIIIRQAHGGEKLTDVSRAL